MSNSKRIPKNSICQFYFYCAHVSCLRLLSMCARMCTHVFAIIIIFGLCIYDVRWVCVCVCVGVRARVFSLLLLCCPYYMWKLDFSTSSLQCALLSFLCGYVFFHHFWSTLFPSLSFQCFLNVYSPKISPEPRPNGLQTLGTEHIYSFQLV